MTLHKRKTRMDREATEAARKSGIFLSRHSYVSTLRRSHAGGPVHPCVFLAGIDAIRQADAIYERDKHRCAECQKVFARPFGDIHHIEGGRKMARCWHESNLEFRCKRHHRAKHPQVRFGEGRARAIADFNELYREGIHE